MPGGDSTRSRSRFPADGAARIGADDAAARDPAAAATKEMSPSETFLSGAAFVVREGLGHDEYGEEDDDAEKEALEASARTATRQACAAIRALTTGDDPREPASGAFAHARARQGGRRDGAVRGAGARGGRGERRPAPRAAARRRDATRRRERRHLPRNRGPRRADHGRCVCCAGPRRAPRGAPRRARSSCGSSPAPTPSRGSS